MRIATPAGVLLVVAHAIALPYLVRACARPDLAVAVDGPTVAPAPSIVGRAPAGLPVIVDDEVPAGPGLHHTRWTATWRGGYTRSVGAVQLVGPFQDPAAPACSARVVVGQRFLDDGRASPGTVAHEVIAAIDGELRGFHQWAAGSYRRTTGVTIGWAARGTRFPDEAMLYGIDAAGYVRVTATIELDRVSVPITVLLVPQLDGASGVRFAVRVHASLEFGNRVFDWVSDKLDGDAFATRLAREQIGSGLVAALGPPPPLELGGGRTLRFTYCGRGPEIVDGAYAALPLAVALAGPTGPERVLPPRYGDVAFPPPPAGTTVDLDLELDALDAMLYELWRTGFLDEQLAAAGLDRRFNDDPTVQAFLSVRLSPLKLALPPVISARADGRLRLAAEALVNLGDRGRTTLGRVWGALDFGFVPARKGVGVDVSLGALELSCVDPPRTLVPCYGDLVAALRDRAGELHGALTATFAKILTDLFVGRELGADGVPAHLVIHGVRATALPGPIVRLALDAAVAE